MLAYYHCFVVVSRKLLKKPVDGEGFLWYTQKSHSRDHGDTGRWFMVKYTAQQIGQLIDIVGASCPDPQFSGPQVVEVTLLDGRMVGAFYYNGPKFETPRC